MKPRYDEAPLLTKAAEIEERIDRLVKAKKCPECEGKGDDCKCKNCPECNGKLDKMGGCMKMGCGGGKMEKAEPGFKAEKITDVNPAFMAESGGQTKSGYFTTNGKTIQTEDAPKKKKAGEKSDMARLGDRMNPHSGTGVEREDSAGESKPLKKYAPSPPYVTPCRTCGARPEEGCQAFDPNIRGIPIDKCPKYLPQV